LHLPLLLFGLLFLEHLLLDENAFLFNVLQLPVNSRALYCARACVPHVPGRGQRSW
jgi:hypothetical protein